MLVEKYGTSCVGVLEGEDYSWPAYVSPWWKDMVTLDNSNWFKSELARNVGNGANTSFWEVAWGGDLAFRIKYPRLFSLSNQKEALVGDLGTLNTPECNWSFSWRRPLFVWEIDLLRELYANLDGFRGSLEEDVWCWKLEEKGVFSVNSLYKKLEGSMLEARTISEEQGRVFSSVWKSPAPSKVVAFSWKLLHDRIPSKANLAVRQVLPPEASQDCNLCEGMIESTNHLFLHCGFVSEVWQGLLRWMDLNFVSPPNLFVHWECWSGAESNKKVRNGFRLIWHAAVWSIWRVRNDRIFNGVNCEVVELVEAIKVLSWRWMLSRLKGPACLYYEWCWCPRECLIR